MMVDIDQEVHELRGVLPCEDRSDFYELDNGNLGVVVHYDTSGEFSKGTFEVIIEYPSGYPNKKPNAWVISPDVDMSCGHIYHKDDSGDANICYMGNRNWDPNYTSYDVAAMVKTWIFAYCKWERTGNWGWNEAGFLDYMLE